MHRKHKKHKTDYLINNFKDSNVFEGHDENSINRKRKRKKRKEENTSVSTCESTVNSLKTKSGLPIIFSASQSFVEPNVIYKSKKSKKDSGIECHDDIIHKKRRNKNQSEISIKETSTESAENGLDLTSVKSNLENSVYSSKCHIEPNVIHKKKKRKKDKESKSYSNETCIEPGIISPDKETTVSTSEYFAELGVIHRKKKTKEDWQSKLSIDETYSEPKITSAKSDVETSVNTSECCIEPDIIHRKKKRKKHKESKLCNNETYIEKETTFPDKEITASTECIAESGVIHGKKKKDRQNKLTIEENYSEPEVIYVENDVETSVNTSECCIEPNIIHRKKRKKDKESKSYSNETCIETGIISPDKETNVSTSEYFAEPGVIHRKKKRKEDWQSKLSIDETYSEPKITSAKSDVETSVNTSECYIEPHVIQKKKKRKKHKESKLCSNETYIETETTFPDKEITASTECIAESGVINGKKKKDRQNKLTIEENYSEPEVIYIESDVQNNVNTSECYIESSVIHKNKKRKKHKENKLCSNEKKCIEAQITFPEKEYDKETTVSSSEYFAEPVIIHRKKKRRKNESELPITETDTDLEAISVEFDEESNLNTSDYIPEPYIMHNKKKRKRDNQSKLSIKQTYHEPDIISRTNDTENCVNTSECFVEPNVIHGKQERKKDQLSELSECEIISVTGDMENSMNTSKCSVKPSAIYKKKKGENSQESELCNNETFIETDITSLRKKNDVDNVVCISEHFAKSNIMHTKKKRKQDRISEFDHRSFEDSESKATSDKRLNEVNFNTSDTSIMLDKEINAFDEDACNNPNRIKKISLLQKNAENSTNISEKNAFRRRRFSDDDLINECYLDVQDDPIDFDLPYLHKYEFIHPFTKEQKNDIFSEGITIKTGKFTKEEDKIIKRNFYDFIKKYDIPNHIEILGIGRYVRNRDILRFIKAKHFYVRLAKGLNNRTLYSVYKRARLIFHPERNSGKLTEKERRSLDKLLSKSNKWHKIGDILGKSPDVCESVYRWSKKNIAKGNFSEEEENQLIEAIKRVAGTSDLSSESLKGISWNKVASHVPTRNFSQCRWYWANHLAWKQDSAKNKWNGDCYRKLIYILSNEWNVDDASMIDWNEVYKYFVDYAPSEYFVSKRWLYLRSQVPNYKNKSYRDIVKILSEKYSSVEEITNIC